MELAGEQFAIFSTNNNFKNWTCNSSWESLKILVTVHLCFVFKTGYKMVQTSCRTRNSCTKGQTKHENRRLNVQPHTFKKSISRHRLGYGTGGGSNAPFHLCVSSHLFCPPRTFIPRKWDKGQIARGIGYREKGKDIEGKTPFPIPSPHNTHFMFPF